MYENLSHSSVRSRVVERWQMLILHLAPIYILPQSRPGKPGEGEKREPRHPPRPVKFQKFLKRVQVSETSENH